jgi:hypothetical protein
MLNIFLKQMREYRIPHALAYKALAALYVGSCLGMDKTLTGAMIAVCYVVMALRGQQ